MISHDRTADPPHEYLGCNDFFGQGSIYEKLEQSTHWIIQKSGAKILLLVVIALYIRPVAVNGLKCNFVLRPSKVRKLVRTNQFQVKSTKMGTGRKFITLQYFQDIGIPIFGGGGGRGDVFSGH